MASMQPVVVTPKFPQLAFSIQKPDDFNQIPLPDESQDFSDPSAMMPLGVFMASYGAVLCTVAARPFAGDPQAPGGSLMEIVMDLASRQLASAGGQVKKLMPERRWGTTVVEVDANQPSEAGEMTLRAIFFEDGGTLYNVSRMAPVAIWGSVEATLNAMVDSFALLQLQGPTRPISPGSPPPAKAQFAVPESAPAASEAIPAPSPAVQAPTPDNAGPDFTAYALNDPHALDLDEAINARLREAGAGLVPNILSRDEARQCALAGAGALAALLPVPFGWHVVDDGRRTLVFDKNNQVQVNFNLFTIEGKSPSDLFTAIIQDLAKENPDVEHRVFEYEDMNAMQVRNLVIDGENLQQAYLLKRHPHLEHLGIKVRITAAEQNLPRAANMAGDMIKHLRFIA